MRGLPEYKTVDLLLRTDSGVDLMLFRKRHYRVKKDRGLRAGRKKVVKGEHRRESGEADLIDAE